ncbi:hypothetical protein BDN72DRAFT_850848, partial [Pluteus cervinus]
LKKMSPKVGLGRLNEAKGYERDKENSRTRNARLDISRKKAYQSDGCETHRNKKTSKKAVHRERKKNSK